MSNTNKTKHQVIATTKEISEILGFTDRRIRQLENEGSLVKVGRNKFDLPASIQRYIEVTKEQSESEEDMDYNKEKTLLTRANRKKAEMELKILQGDVHKSEDVENVMNDMLTSFRAQVLVIPGKAASQVLGLTELEVIKDILKEMIHETLQELSDYEPNIFHGKDVVELEEKLEGKINKNKNSSKKNDRKQDKD